MASLPRHLFPSGSTSPSPLTYLFLGTCLGLGLSLSHLLLLTPKSPASPPRSIPAPVPSSHTTSPYPPSSLPGSRLLRTPYGTISIYEFGPADSRDKVLLLPGIGTPVLALGDLALRLADAHGCRVMLFDLFGRGYSDAPRGLPHDERLYASQILLVLASSPLAWTGDEAFHLVGYSLGGGLAAAFARWYPRMVRSLTCVAGGGLIRREKHVGWRSWLLYDGCRGWVPEWVVERIVEGRIRPARRETAGEEGKKGEAGVENAQSGRVRKRDSDADGGEGWDSTLLSKKRPGAHTVADVMEWQVREHAGFVSAFVSCIRHAPIYDRTEEWAALGRELAVRRGGDAGVVGLRPGRVLLVVGKRDSVIVKEELVEDAARVLGGEGIEVVEVDAGHELAFTHADEVADAAVRFWRQ